MGPVGESDNRRSFKRIQAPIVCRAARLTLRPQPVDIGLGGLRVYCDERFKVGKRLELELFLPEGSSVVCIGRVAWVNELEDSSVAKFDIGLEFLEVSSAVRDRLASVLGTRTTSDGAQS
jgi:Tfp pilus assembly protein PilZ